MESLTWEDPRSIGGYELRAHLGEGAFGRVYLGLSPGGRAVAIKVLRPELARDREFLSRFWSEVAAAQQVNGFYTAQVVGSGLDDQPPWVATAFVPGPPLSQAVAANGPFPELAVWRLLAGLAEALQAIHGCGLVHRDLKPANVLLAADGPRVIDFGISKAVDGTALTSAGVVLGTPSFMAPEQAEGKAVGPAADVFALGCVLAYAATGTPPFGSGTYPSVLYRVVHGDPMLDGIPPQLRAVIERCLAKEPAARPGLTELAMTAGDGQVSARSSVSFWPPQVGQLIRDYQSQLDAAGAQWLASGDPARAVATPDPGPAIAPSPTLTAGLRPPTDSVGSQSGPVSVASAFVLRRGGLRRPGAVNALAFSPDGAIIATGSSDRCVRLWDARTGKHIRTLSDHPAAVHSVAFSPDGQLLAAGCAKLNDSGAVAESAQGVVQLWHPSTGRLQHTLYPRAGRTSTDHISAVLALAFRPDGKLLAVGGHALYGRRHPVQFWEPFRSGWKFERSMYAGECVHSVTYSAGGQLLATASDNGQVILDTGGPPPLEGHDGAVLDVALSGDGGLAATAGYDKTVRTWALTRSEHGSLTSQCLRVLTGHELAVLAVALSPDGHLLASAGRDGNVFLWDPRTGDRCAALPRHEAAVPTVAFSPNGKLLATGCEDGTARIWRVESATSAI